MRDLSTRAAAAIRAEMARQNITQQQLAAACGWRQQYLSRRLTGDVGLCLDELAAIAAALDVPPVEFIRQETAA